MNYKFVLLMLFFFGSCTTVKYKKNYIINKWRSFDKYKYQNEISFEFSEKQLGFTLTDSSLRRIKMKKIKTSMIYWERIIVLSPDSVSSTFITEKSQSARLDSFYINEEKKRFITQNNLLTVNKHFLESVNK